MKWIEFFMIDVFFSIYALVFKMYYRFIDFARFCVFLCKIFIYVYAEIMYCRIRQKVVILDEGLIFKKIDDLFFY